MVLETLALERQGRRDEALERLAEALDLAVPGGWLRPFAEAGQAMVELLARLPQRAQDRRFLAQLHQASHEPGGSREAPDRNEGVLQPLVEALTNRELDVLELLAQRLYDKEIAAALSITVGTVRTHVKHIYGKLEVSNRREAVAKAGELGLLK